MRNGLSYFVILIISFVSLNFSCGDIPEGAVVIPLETYDSLRAGAIIKEVPIPPDYDSVDAVWNGRLIAEIEIREQEHALAIEDHVLNLETCQTNRAKDISELNLQIVALDWEIVDLEKALEICENEEAPIEPKELIKLIPREVKVDTVHPNGNLNGENIIDGIPYVSTYDRGTRWSVPGYGHWMFFNFDTLVTIKKIGMNVFAWDEGYTHFMTVYNYPDSIMTFETKPFIVSWHDMNITTKQIAIRVNGGQNSWTDIGEIFFEGYVIE